MRFLLGMLVLIASSESSLAAGCGSRGGPGFRAPNGKCVGWKQLNKVCGNPPTSHCAYEGDGIGDTSLDGGKNFLLQAGSAASSAKAFNARTVKANGIACLSTQYLAQMKACPSRKASTDCEAQVQQVIATGDCAPVLKGTDASIQAGSHSFDWLRVRLPGHEHEMWIERSLVLE